MAINKIVSMKELLEAGAHFGHRSNVWNPKMDRYIFTKRNKVHIIDLQKTLLLVEKAYGAVRNLVGSGGQILFVGTKKQAKQVIIDEAQRSNSYYINHRWIGGLLTNFKVISKSITKLKKYNKILEDENSREDYSKKELSKLQKKADKMSETLSGIMDMKKLPDLIFVADAFSDKNVILEARLLGIPICAIVDTNADPDIVDIPIPANDDAVRSIKIFTNCIANAVLEGQKMLANRGVDMEQESDQLLDNREEAKDHSVAGEVPTSNTNKEDLEKNSTNDVEQSKDSGSNENSDKE